MEFIIKQDIDLQADNPVKNYQQGFEVGDKRAHTWRVRVLDGGRSVDLSEATCMCYFTRPDVREKDDDPGYATVVFAGMCMEGGWAEATLPQACYAYPGEVVAILRVSMGESVIAMAKLRSRINCDTEEVLLDPERRIPNLEELLTQIDAMESATKAANEATERARKSASNADRATQDADDATRVARELTDKWDDVSLEYAVLPPSEDPWASLTQTEHETKFKFGLPQSNHAYSTFEVTDDMELLMHSPEGFSDIGFHLTEDGDLEVAIN